MAPHIANMITNIAHDLDMSAGNINIKAKTNEKCDAIGQEEAIAVFAVVAWIVIIAVI